MTMEEKIERQNREYKGLKTEDKIKISIKVKDVASQSGYLFLDALKNYRKI